MIIFKSFKNRIVSLFYLLLDIITITVNLDIKLLMNYLLVSIIFYSYYQTFYLNYYKYIIIFI
jgi:hypothetical protein